ncbi:MAG TPA: 8-amino-7-oxononanoate synthase [Planctomycetaceae bacterium]|nr:8-amino-7-oxononanoate synthase [Planctomycetaceae bacterium]
MTRDPAWLADDLEGLKRSHLVRPRRLVKSLGPGRSLINGRELVDFSTNDYLGLARDTRLTRASADVPTGAGASPLVTGRSEQYCQLEQDIADFEGTESEILFPSGFAANLGTVAALVGPGDTVFSDRLNHASLIDGCRLSGARLRVYQQDSLDHLNQQLAASASSTRRLIVTDGLFSMDGTVAPLDTLCDLAETHDAMLLVDEAHATGVLGDTGRGTCEFLGVEDRVTLRIGTLSKAVGAAGGFVAASTPLVDFLWHHARTQVFSTAIPPATCAAASAGLCLIKDNKPLRQHLQQLATRLRNHIARLGLDTPSTTGPIVPIILGDSSVAVSTSDRLVESGFFVPAIRPPSVPADTARLRISLSAAHTETDIDRLADSLAKSVSPELTARG